MKGKVKFTFVRLLFSLIFLIGFTPFKQVPVQANALVGTIAYVVPNQPDGDEIHLIEPDGNGSRLLFRTNNPLPDVLSDIVTLAWKPDASELAFASAHENTCSAYESDIYAIHPDGQNYRRVTSRPACGARAGLPTGTVTVPVYNGTDKMGPFLIYIEGAPGAKSLAMAPGSGPMMVTFENVADYGAQEQYAVFMSINGRFSYAGAHVDVVPGMTVQTGPLMITAGLSDWGFYWPTYLPDGSTIATIFGGNMLYEFDANNNEPGWSGFDQTEYNLEMGGQLLAWGPTPALASKFLYYDEWTDSNWTIRQGIILGDINDLEGQVVIEVDPNQEGDVVLGLAWLPDGSGFLYSYKQFIYYTDNWMDGWYEAANVWEYSFATGQSKQLTDVPIGWTRAITISPDGSKIVYEYQPSGNWIDPNPPIDLWMMNRDGKGQTMFVENARTPAWSPAPIPVNNPFPVLASINPSSANTGAAGFTVTASGSGFVKGSVVRWNGAALPTTYVDATKLTAQVPADRIAAAGTANVTIYNPTPGGGESQAKTFTISNEFHSVYVPIVIH